MPSFPQFIAFAASVMGVVMSVGYYAQAYKIFKNKSAHDVSALTYAIFSLGTLTWLVYGITAHDRQIIWGFVFGVIGAWLVLALTIIYKERKKQNI